MHDSEKSIAEHTKSDNNFLKPITNLSTEKSVSLSNVAGKILNRNNKGFKFKALTNIIKFLTN